MTAIIDYGAGNTKSVINLLDRMQETYVLSDQADIILSADRIILPGVGHACAAMDMLRERDLVSVLKQFSRPILGICLGMQLFFDYSEEGETECLGLIDGSVRRFPVNTVQKVPHMGWNTIAIDKGCPLFKKLDNHAHFYFVHSYYADSSPNTIATCEHIITFSAAVFSKNIYGVQFHPEKSGSAGEQLIRNFIEIV
jgi:glutamine amidotransferase